MLVWSLFSLSISRYSTGFYGYIFPYRHLSQQGRFRVWFPSPSIYENGRWSQFQDELQIIPPSRLQSANHDDVIQRKHFPRNWPFVRSPVNSPPKGQWCGALVFSLICVWINDWLNNHEAGDLRRYRAHYDVIAMCACHCSFHRKQTILSLWSRLSSHLLYPLK